MLIPRIAGNSNIVHENCRVNFKADDAGNCYQGLKNQVDYEPGAGARGGAVDCDTALEAGRWRVRFPLV